MTNDQKFSVATLSVDERERHWLKGIIEISETRAVKFVAFAPKPGTTPDIVIVDADKPKAFDRWNAYLKANANGKRIFGIVIARQPLAELPKYFLQRPVIATRLVAMLEKIAIAEHQAVAASAFAPEDLVESAKPSATSTPPVNNAKPAAQTRLGFTALVVDDSLPVRVQLKTALKNLATHVDFAETGEEALEFLDRKRYDIVFLDVILPGIDGYDICRSIKRDPAKKSMPVIMLTGNSSPADRVKGTLAGCDTYLIKPVRQAVFEEVVKEFVRTPTAA
jgi:twitching motility two-component system response regulator PilG